MVERFNKTLLNMMGTLSEDKKGNWVAHVSTLTHAYHAAIHESTGFSPYFLMFGRHPRLVIDAFLGLKSVDHKGHKDYADKLRERLKHAYKKATEEAQKKGVKYKHYYDQKVRNATLEVGDRVLVKKVGIKGKHKLSDIWEPYTYVVVDQPMPDIPVFSVQKKGSNAKPKLLHRNMLLPFYGIPVPEESDTEYEIRQQPRVLEEEEESDKSTDSDSSTDEDREEPTPERRYVIPARRGRGRRRALPEQGIDRQETMRFTRRPQTTPRPQRTRRPPAWMQLNDWQVGHRPFIFTVRPEDVSYL